MIVMKFGGSSIKSEDDIHRIINIIGQHRDEMPIVVISALYQVTNRLERIAALAAMKKTDSARTTSHELFEEHLGIADRSLSRQRKKPFFDETKIYKEQIDHLIDGLSLVGEVTGRTIDQFSSYGERLASQLFALMMQESGLPAELIGAEKYLFTSGEYTRAVPLFDEVRETVQKTFQPVIAGGSIPVTPGFIGITKQNIWTTMGRESSDYTASLIGTYLAAKEIQLWKEVEGIRTADPEIIQITQPVEKLSYREALELANLGAKVLHPRTILPVIETGLPIRVLSSRVRESGQTFITADTEHSGVKSITCKKGIDLIRISAPYHANGDIKLANLNQYIRTIPVDIHLTLQVGSETVILIDTKKITDDLIDSLKQFGSVERKTGSALVGIVGENIGSVPDYGITFVDALKGIREGVLLSGASPRSICAVVPESHSQDLVEKLHRRFFIPHHATGK